MTTLMATGDSMITRGLVHDRRPAFTRLVELIRSGDAAFTNFEMGTPREPIVPNVNHPSAFQYSKPFVLDELKACGFNLVGAGNNHVADYGPKGLLDLLEELDARNLTTAGAGVSLGDARRPGYLDTTGGRIALLAVTSTNVEHSMAVARRPDMDGRPGVNPLRFRLEYRLEPRLFDALSEIDEALGTAAAFRHRAQFAALMGHANPDAHTFLGASFFRSDQGSGVVSKPHAGDMAALEQAIQGARRQADVVVVSLHAHEGPAGDMNQEIPAEFIVEASHKAIDAGADVVVGHGPHMLRGIEIYKGKPIYLSLGSFVFQIETLQRQPAPAYEKHGLPHDALPVDVTDEVGSIRSGEPRGFWDRRFWTSVVAETRFEGREVKEINLHPIDLQMEAERWQRGSPLLADAGTSRWVLEGLQELSPNVEIRIDEGAERTIGRVAL